MSKNHFWEKGWTFLIFFKMLSSQNLKVVKEHNSVTLPFCLARFTIYLRLSWMILKLGSRSKHDKICFLRCSKSHFSPLFLLTKMQNLMKKRSLKSRMGNVRVDTSAQWQKQKNKQLLRFCLLSRWLSLGKTKICLFFSSL